MESSFAMGNDDSTAPTGAGDVARSVNDFYERHPYPPPVDDLDAYRRSWDDRRRRAESHLYWPAEPYREDRSILVAGCGTAQAAHYALRWPRATRHRNRRQRCEHRVHAGLEAKIRARQSRVEVNLPSNTLPNSGKRSTTSCAPACSTICPIPTPACGRCAPSCIRPARSTSWSMRRMVAPGFTCFRSTAGGSASAETDAEIDDLAAALKALSPDHPLAPLLRKSPDFATKAGLADALLHPKDRSYSVPQLLEFLERAGLAFGRWVRQAPYLPWCGTFASSPHHAAARRAEPDAQYAADRTVPRHDGTA